MLFSVITLLTILDCYSARLLPRDDKDFTELQKQKADSPQNSFLLKKNLTALRSPKPTPSANITSTNAIPPKKWQVGRVTRKQYEIINMLWRKTKVFVNVEITTSYPTSKATPKHSLKSTLTSSSKHNNLTQKIFDVSQRENPFIFTARSPISQSLTPSYIEFYYSDETGENFDSKDCVNNMCQLKNSEKLNTNIINSQNSSFLMFHIKGPLSTRTTGRFYSNKFNTNSVSTSLKSYEEYHSIYKPDMRQNISDLIAKKLQTESTTVYDKIKFFEMYDKHTHLPYAKKGNKFQFDYEKSEEEIIINNCDTSKILLEHIDQSSHEHNESKHSKKHIVEMNKNLSHSSVNTIKENSKPKAFLNVTTERQNNVSLYHAIGSIVRSETREFKNIYSYINKSVSWSTYPFAAVYVNEPSQVHCDAASISAHWLVVSGSCLSRLNHRPMLGDGRSAFVAYCGENWWQPERVSYVKYSLIHPWYHPRDRTRRHLYNIGVIQVVTSMMSACGEWAPVSLMSHQFAANQGGSEASALGWGLDRYDTRYAAEELPKLSLSVYKGLVFSDSCPGNTGYGKIKQFGGGDGLRNVYCLSLPPYSGEERDPVHGGLLLVGGKLIALYLQEERRPWGEQSAQYTGIWNLIAWVTEVAREPEELEFSDEI